MSSDFIKREEFSVEIRGLRDDIKSAMQMWAGTMQEHMSRLTDEIKETEAGWRQRSHDLADKVMVSALKQAVQEKQIEALEAMPQLDALKDVVTNGFAEVNRRLGLLEQEQGHQRQRMERFKDQPHFIPLNSRMKVMLGVGSGVSLLAVLHSLFEMVSRIGPGLMALLSSSSHK